MGELINKEKLEALCNDLGQNLKKDQMGEDNSYYFSEELNNRIMAIEEREEKKVVDKIYEAKGVRRPSIVEKCLQVLKYIIIKHPDPDIYNVLKMLYFADRIHLFKYGELITFDRYVKLEHGPVPSLCYNIIKFVRNGEDYYNCFDDAIKREIQVCKDPETHKQIKLKHLTKPDMNCLTGTNIECIDEAIKNYGHHVFHDLKRLSHDKIYASARINEEITIFDMVRILDKENEEKICDEGLYGEAG
jgi:uncharacterized phage-associated protein